MFAPPVISTPPPQYRTWLVVAATPSQRVTDEEAALRQIKVRITDIIERKALWTTGNNIIL
jgi:hypothetical protein